MMCICLKGLAQQSIHVIVTGSNHQRPLEGATVSMMDTAKQVQATGRTDSLGRFVFPALTSTSFSVTVSYTGYEGRDVFVVAFGNDTTIHIALEPAMEEEEEVIVRSTRTSRSIRNVPTRVETIGREELDEKNNMRPANISMLLHESTGIQVQQTSATSANTSIRIQGLDGRYTQLLKNGFGNYGNFASGLSVLEIPPLDLQQVEIIKGPASTLYGGGAIAGVINLLSRTPGDKPVNDLLFNQSNVGQTNLGYFSSARSKKIGYTFMGSLNRQHAYDVDHDDFTELPKTAEFTINPVLYLYASTKTTLIIGNSFTGARRKGGDVQVVNGHADAAHVYFEENSTIRNITTVELKKQLAGKDNLDIRQSFSLFDRHIEIPAYHFDGVSYNSFTDVSWVKFLKSHTLVLGANVVSDRFNEKAGSAGSRDNSLFSAGLYIQDTWDLSDRYKLESGLRLDGARFSNDLFSKTEYFLLPRISLLVKYNDQVTSRIGGGLGYKTPSLFTERTETFQYQGVLQLNGVKSERSAGFTADVDIKTRISGDLAVTLNQLFFYTSIGSPLVTRDDGAGDLRFVNMDQPIRSLGFETNARLTWRGNLKLFLGYTYTNAKAAYLAGSPSLPLVPKHRFNSALIYEKRDFIKLGLEAYYTSRQDLYNGTRTSEFWECGFMAEKLFPKWSVYVNFENFTDTRQSRYGPVVTGTHTDPVFADIWTHTEGFVVNGGIKLKL